jgi:nucleolar pre-ribosomal-associated protein 1
VLNTISHVLTLLSKHADAHSSAAPILKTIYTPAIQGRLTGYLSGGQNDSIIGALKIFNAAASFPSGGDLKQAMEHFPWGLKALPKLLFMRRKGKDSLGANDMMYRPGLSLSSRLRYRL